MLQLSSYRTIAAVADAVGEPFLVVKGPVLGAVWYGDPSVRQFSDIDVLVRRSDFGAFLAQLLDAGFGERSQNWRGFLDHEVAEIPLAHGHATIDLHWDLVASERSDANSPGTWNRCSTAPKRCSSRRRR